MNCVLRRWVILEAQRQHPNIHVCVVHSSCDDRSSKDKKEKERKPKI
jgi:hypothetical protein